MFTPVDKHKGTPSYIQIMNIIKKELLLRRLKEGNQLPPVRQLQKIFDVNINTVTKALDKLTVEGIVEPKHGIGYFIKSGNPANPEAINILKESIKKLKETGTDLNTAVLILEEIWKNDK